MLESILSISYRNQWDLNSGSLAGVGGTEEVDLYQVRPLAYLAQKAQQWLSNVSDRIYSSLTWKLNLHAEQLFHYCAMALPHCYWNWHPHHPSRVLSMKALFYTCMDFSQINRFSTAMRKERTHCVWSRRVCSIRGSSSGSNLLCVQHNIRRKCVGGSIKAMCWKR